LIQWLNVALSGNAIRLDSHTYPVVFFIFAICA
jgi:hypothetical protein